MSSVVEPFRPVSKRDNRIVQNIRSGLEKCGEVFVMPGRHEFVLPFVIVYDEKTELQTCAPVCNPTNALTVTVVYRFQLGHHGTPDEQFSKLAAWFRGAKLPGRVRLSIHSHHSMWDDKTSHYLVLDMLPDEEGAAFLATLGQSITPAYPKAAAMPAYRKTFNRQRDLALYWLSCILAVLHVMPPTNAGLKLPDEQEVPLVKPTTLCWSNIITKYTFCNACTSLEDVEVNGQFAFFPLYLDKRLYLLRAESDKLRVAVPAGMHSVPRYISCQDTELVTTTEEGTVIPDQTKLNDYWQHIGLSVVPLKEEIVLKR
jgi:hypothetical protein